MKNIPSFKLRNGLKKIKSAKPFHQEIKDKIIPHLGKGIVMISGEWVDKFKNEHKDSYYKLKYNEPIFWNNSSLYYSYSLYFENDKLLLDVSTSDRDGSWNNYSGFNITLECEPSLIQLFKRSILEVVNSRVVNILDKASDKKEKKIIKKAVLNYL